MFQALARVTVFVEGVWRIGISTHSVEAFQLSKHNSVELYDLFNIVLLLYSP